MSLTQQLRLFYDVVQQGAFTKAAALHNMDNSALSKQIKKLEQQLGVQLLNRSTRSISLTSAGEEIWMQAGVMLETLARIHAIADAYQAEPTGALRITAPVFFGQHYLQPVIHQFVQQYPQVELILTLDDKKAQIIADRFDLAFRVGRLSDSSLIAQKMASAHLVLVASKPFVAEHAMPRTPEELVALPAVIYANADTTLDQLTISTEPHSDRMKSYRLRGNFKANDVQTVVSMVQAGAGFALLDLFNLTQPLDELGLVPLLSDHRLTSHNGGIFALYPHRNATPLVREFIQQVQAHIGTPPFWADYLPNYEQLYR